MFHCLALDAGDEHLGNGVPPVVHTLGEVADSVHASVDVNKSLARAVLQVAGIRVACGAGDEGAQLVVGLRAYRKQQRAG